MKKFLYGLSSFTGGIIGTLIGLIVGLFFFIKGDTSRVYKGSINTDKNFFGNGCFSIGICTFTDGFGDGICDHEFGHCIQNAIGGPLVFFVVYIPSMINFLYCTIKGDYSSHDKMGCERNATSLGSKIG